MTPFWPHDSYPGVKWDWPQNVFKRFPIKSYICPSIIFPNSHNTFFVKNSSRRNLRADSKKSSSWLEVSFIFSKCFRVGFCLFSARRKLRAIFFCKSGSKSISSWLEENFELSLRGSESHWFLQGKSHTYPEAGKNILFTKQNKFMHQLA